MGHFNEILAGRFNRFAQKHFSMKGREGAPTLAADIGLTLNFSNGAENRYLEGWDLAAWGGVIPAIAAQVTNLELRNPVGSGVVAVVYSLQGGETTATTIASPMVVSVVRSATSDQNLIITAVCFDQRGRPSPTAILSRNTAAPSAVGGTSTIIRLPTTLANQTVDLMPSQMEIPLLPGNALLVATGNVNDQNALALAWRERAIEDSEKF